MNRQTNNIRGKTKRVAATKNVKRRREAIEPTTTNEAAAKPEVGKIDVDVVMEEITQWVCEINVAAQKQRAKDAKAEKEEVEEELFEYDVKDSGPQEELSIYEVQEARRDGLFEKADDLMRKARYGVLGEDRQSPC